jgi:hypothetical protein
MFTWLTKLFGASSKRRRVPRRSEERHENGTTTVKMPRAKQRLARSKARASKT